MVGKKKILELQRSWFRSWSWNSLTMHWEDFWVSEIHMLFTYKMTMSKTQGCERIYVNEALRIIPCTIYMLVSNTFVLINIIFQK